MLAHEASEGDGAVATNPPVCFFISARAFWAWSLAGHSRGSSQLARDAIKGPVARLCAIEPPAGGKALS